MGDRLYEDEAVAILERTQIGGNQRLASCIGETHLQRYDASARGTDILRDVMKRIRRLHAFTSFHATTTAERKDLVREALDSVEAAILKQ